MAFNRSEFYSSLWVGVRREGNDYVIEARGATAIANTIAFLTEDLDPVSVVLGLTRRNVMKQSLAYVLWGEGETDCLSTRCWSNSGLPIQAAITRCSF